MTGMNTDGGLVLIIAEGMMINQSQILASE